MSTALKDARNARCMASPDAPGKVNLEFRRADGRVIPLQLDHQAAAAFAKRLALQSQLAELYQNGRSQREE